MRTQRHDDGGFGGPPDATAPAELPAEEPPLAGANER